MITDDGQITIPLQAWFPCPNIQFDGYLSLGATLVQHNVSKMLPMKNFGNRAGKFKLTYDQSLGLSVTPKQGLINPNEKTEIRVDYFGTEQGTFEFMVNVEVSFVSLDRVTHERVVVMCTVSLPCCALCHFLYRAVLSHGTKYAVLRLSA